MSADRTLAQLAENLGGSLVNISPAAAAALSVKSLAADSNQATSGAVFLALPGTVADGHQFVPAAFRQGAVAAVVEQADALAGQPGIVVADSRQALSAAAAWWHHRPSQHLKVVGITGTNGKTTVNWLLYQVLNRLADGALRIGTLGIAGPGLKERESLTTPDALALQGALREAVDGGLKNAVIEISSHGLSQGRADAIELDVGVFTNLTQDHLDYHADFEDYFRAKCHLFEILAGSAKHTKAAVLGIDCPYGRRLVELVRELGLREISFGTASSALFRIADFSQNFSGSRLTLQTPVGELVLNTRLIGMFNAQNLAAVCAVAWALELDLRQLAETIGELPLVPGRLEAVTNQAFAVLVDYAHTPDALENALKALRDLAQQRLWVIFGCGGDRDRGKRPLMGQAAARWADRVVVTSDNPRTEDPDRIIADILSSGLQPELVEADRRRAIAATIARLAPGDVLLIAGKGHEDYQIIGRNKVHFSDQEEVRRCLEG